MTEQQARLVSDVLGGEAWRNQSGVWVVSINRIDGAVVVVDADGVREYSSDGELDAGHSSNEILLTGVECEAGFWCVEDSSGSVYYRNSILEAGWRWKEDAEEAASEIYSRTGRDCWTKRVGG